jgi:hypothetical protein
MTLRLPIGFGTAPSPLRLCIERALGRRGLPRQELTQDRITRSRELGRREREGHVAVDSQNGLHAAKSQSGRFWAYRGPKR